MKCVWLILTLCWAAFGQAQAPAKGSIEGQAVNAKTGAPLKKASVRLTMIVPPSNGPAGVRMQGPNMRTVDTDEAGRFSFTGLDAGKYRLSADRQGFLHQNYGERKYSGGGTPVLVAEGQNVKSLLFRMNPQGVITGKVLDEDGEPLANVQVRASRYMYLGGKRQWTQAATANSSDIGEYRLADLQPGRYLISTNPRNVRVNVLFQANNEPVSAAPDMA